MNLFLYSAGIMKNPTSVINLFGFCFAFFGPTAKNWKNDFHNAFPTEVAHVRGS